MADYAPPPGPPPPSVPAGWKAIYNDQYHEWFYVNTYTKQSQWEKPTEPVYPQDAEAGSSDTPPPSYDSGPARGAGTEKAKYNSNNPFNDHNQMSEDEKLARQLQEEENARSAGTSGDRGEADSYYSQAPAYGQGASNYGGQQSSVYPSQSGSYPQQSNELPPRPEQKKGLLGKLFNKTSSSSQQQVPPQYGYGAPQQPQYYGGYAAPHGYPPGGMYAQRPHRQGMGAGTGAALGLGGGLLGGMLLGEALEGHHGGDDGGYGGDDGGGYGGDDGGGFGGDDGGGDFGGGDFGGGDFGGGDMGGDF